MGNNPRRTQSRTRFCVVRFNIVLPLSELDNKDIGKRKSLITVYPV